MLLLLLRRSHSNPRNLVVGFELRYRWTFEVFLRLGKSSEGHGFLWLWTAGDCHRTIFRIIWMDMIGQLKYGGWFDWSRMWGAIWKRNGRAFAAWHIMNPFGSIHVPPGTIGHVERDGNTHFNQTFPIHPFMYISVSSDGDVRDVHI